MSKSKSKDAKETNGKQFIQRARNLGPAGFQLFEYLGTNKDHSSFWISFKKNLRSTILQQKYDLLLESIIDTGVDPAVPELNLEELIKDAPARTVATKAAAHSDDQSDSTRGSKSKAKIQLLRTDQESDGMEDENPLYAMQLNIFNNKIKTLSTARENRALKVTADKESFYVIIWLQCGLSMQNFLRSVRDFSARHSAKDVLWLYKALEAVGTGTVALSETDSEASTLTILTGMSKGNYENIHTYYERWKLAYVASVAAGNQAFKESVKIEFFNKSLDDSYNAFKGEMHNRKVLKGDLPTTLEENFWQACNFVTAPTAASSDARAVFYTADQHAAAARNRKPRSKAESAGAAHTKGKGGSGGKGGNGYRGKGKTRTDPEWLAQQTCYGCRQLGHLIADCPAVGKADSDGGEDTNVAAAAHTAGKKGNHCRMIAWTSSTPNAYLLALDNCAYSSVLCNADFASDIVKGSCAPLLNWNGESHVNDSSGVIHPFGYCEINDKAPINLLSEFEVRSRFRVEDRYADKISVGNPTSKVVHVGGTQVEFMLDSNTRQYVADWRQYSRLFTYSPQPHSVNVVISSVKQNEAMFTKDEVRRAKLARELIAKSGYASKEDMMRLVSSSGNFVNIEITRADVQRAVDIYGSQHVLHGRSRIMRPDTRVLRTEPLPKHLQDLYTDKFNIFGLWFLLCNVKPLGVLLVKHLDGQTESHLGRAFADFVAILQSFKYETAVIYSDADPAAIANINQHSRVRVEACAAGDHVEEAESPIRTVKERFRSVKAGILFELTKRLVIELVQFIVGRINIGISQYSVDGLCPRVRLTEIILDAKKELCTGFGYLVVARNKNVVSNDAMELRGEVCLALRPVGNRQGSWRMMKLINGRIVSRSQFKEVPMTDLALARLSELARMENAGHPICLDDEVEYEDPPDVLSDDFSLNELVYDFPITHSLDLSENGGGMPAETVLTESVSVSHDDADAVAATAPEDFEPLTESASGHVENREDKEPVQPQRYSNQQQVSETGDAAYVTTASDRGDRAQCGV